MENTELKSQEAAGGPALLYGKSRGLAGEGFQFRSGMSRKFMCQTMLQNAEVKRLDHEGSAVD